MPVADEWDSQGVALEVAKIAKQIFFVDLSGDPSQMYKEVFDLFRSCSIGDERVKTFANEVNMRKFPELLQTYLPRAPDYIRDFGTVRIPAGAITPELRRAFQLMSDDTPTKGYSLSIFESIFGESGGRTLPRHASREDRS